MKTRTASSSVPFTVIQHPIVWQLCTISASKIPTALPDSAIIAAASLTAKVAAPSGMSSP